MFKIEDKVRKPKPLNNDAILKFRLPKNVKKTFKLNCENIDIDMTKQLIKMIKRFNNRYRKV